MKRVEGPGRRSSEMKCSPPRLSSSSGAERKSVVTRAALRRILIFLLLAWIFSASMLLMSAMPVARRTPSASIVTLDFYFAAELPAQVSSSPLLSNLNDTSAHMHAGHAGRPARGDDQEDPAVSISTDGFGGCLLIKEDNHRLDEWIAYHLVVLPLQYLIVAVDPTSGQSPLPILSKWNGTMGLFVEVWSDDDFIPEEIFSGPRWRKQCNRGHDTNMMDNYLTRQRAFMKRCAVQMKQSNMTWVSFVDSDEFWIFNHIDGDKDEDEIDSHALQVPAARRRLPGSLGKGITIYDWLNKERDEHGFPDMPCYVAPRLLFSAVESTPEERERLGRSNFVQLGFGNVTQFNTLRFFRHVGKSLASSSAINMYGKPVMDVSRVLGLVERTFANPHYPIKGNPKGVCGDLEKDFNSSAGRSRHHQESVLRINHYLGSMEEYLARHDARRSSESFLERASLERGTSYTVLPWLRLFVERIGSAAEAQELLRDAGVLVPFEPVKLCRNNATDVDQPRVPFFFPASRGGGWPAS